MCDYDVLEGDVTVETYTVSHDRSGEARRLIVAARDDQGIRTWCHSTDADLMRRAETEEIIGLRATISAGDLALNEVAQQHFERDRAFAHNLPGRLRDVDHG